MAEDKLLTIREVSLYLGVSEKEVIDLAESGELPAYKIGGVYLRFKHEQVQEFKKKFKHSHHKNIPQQRYSLNDRISDFFYFNDFYILSALIIAIILLLILRGYK